LLGFCVFPECEHLGLARTGTLSVVNTDARSTGTEGGSPPSRWGLRTLRRFVMQPLPFLQDLAEKHGDIVPLRMVGKPWLLLSHPDDVEALLVAHAGDVGRDDYIDVLKRVLGEGLLTSEGELWKRQRRLASGAFTPKRIRGYASAMSRVTDEGLRRWKDGERVMLHEEMSRLTLEVVADVLFGASVSAADVATVRESMEVFNEYFAQSPEVIFRIPRTWPTPRHRALDHALREVDALIRRIIETRRRSGERRDDVLDALLAATDDDGSKMSDQQLRDEVVTLFLAGHETTALALTHVLYLLAKHPEARRRVEAEVDEVLAGRLPTQEDVPRLVYTERTIKEAMRLYPPAWLTGREVTRAFTVAGRTVPVGTQVLVSQWVVHRDPRWWAHPEAFDPDRFEPELVKARPRFSYFPFGGGPRICIGNHFAMMEAVLMLAIIAQRWQVDLLPFEELRFSPSVTLRPKGHGLRASLARRPERASVPARDASPRA
jgi:cytochrome P450